MRILRNLKSHNDYPIIMTSVIMTYLDASINMFMTIVIIIVKKNI